MAGHFTSRFTPVECAMKAQSAIVAEADVVGMTTGDLVLVRKLKGNMFQSVGRARLDQGEEGTLIRLTTGPDRLGLSLCMFFLAARVLIDVFWMLAYGRIFQSFQFSDADRGDWILIGLPFVATLLGFGLFHLGRYQSKDDGPFLRRLLVDAMDAKPKGKTAPV